MSSPLWFVARLGCPPGRRARQAKERMPDIHLLGTGAIPLRFKVHGQELVGEKLAGTAPVGDRGPPLLGLEQ